jgi:hypothetical protein
MKTGFVIVALTFGLLAGVMTGASLAGDGRSEAWAVSGSADPGRASVDAWLNQGSIETGALPQTQNSASRSDGVASDDTEFPFVEIGGVRYRVGMDTGA